MENKILVRYKQKNEEPQGNNLVKKSSFKTEFDLMRIELIYQYKKKI